MTKVCHGVVPALSPACAALYHSGVAGHMPAHLHSVCEEAHLACQAGLEHRRPFLVPEKATSGNLRPALEVSPASCAEQLCPSGFYPPHIPEKKPSPHLAFSIALCSVVPSVSALDPGLAHTQQPPFAGLNPSYLQTFLGLRKDSPGLAGHRGKEQQPSCDTLPRAAPAPCPRAQHCQGTLAE